MPASTYSGFSLSIRILRSFPRQTRTRSITSQIWRKCFERHANVWWHVYELRIWTLFDKDGARLQRHGVDDGVNFGFVAAFGKIRNTFDERGHNEEE